MSGNAGPPVLVDQFDAHLNSYTFPHTFLAGQSASVQTTASSL